MKNIFRYERKFVINNLTIPELENLLRNSAFKFKKNFSERMVNSIYFDNHNKNSILENLDGNNFKTKFRLRWYGDKRVIKSPVLELKKRSPILTIKSYFKLKILKK